MKKYILFTILLLVLPLTGFAAERIVLAELFTSTTCPPCVGGNLVLTNKLAERNDLIAVRYHMNWPSPGNDPFCHHNGENMQRRYYYGDITGVPHQKIDGKAQPASDFFIDERMTIEPTVAMRGWSEFEFTAFNASQGQGTVYLELTNEESSATSRKLYGALVENDIAYTGTNGDPEHDQVMIYMIPGGDGEIISFAADETKILEYEIEICDTVPFLDANLDPIGEVHVVDAANCEVVFWLQNDGTKEVLNATVAPLHGPLTADVSSSTVGNENGMLIPDEEVEFFVTLLNTSDWNWDEVMGILTTDDEMIDIPDSIATWTEIPAGEKGTNEADPFTILLSEDGEEGYRPEVSLKISSGKGASQNIQTEFTVYEPTGVAAENDTEFFVEVPAIVRGNDIILLSSPRASYGELTLFDVTGRMIKEIYAGDFSAGMNLVPISGDGLSEGVYFVKVTFAGHRQVDKLMILN